MRAPTPLRPVTVSYTTKSGKNGRFVIPAEIVHEEMVRTNFGAYSLPRNVRIAQLITDYAPSEESEPIVAFRFKQ